MGQDINVDFGLLGKPPDFVGDYANAFKVGRDLAPRQNTPNAFVGGAAATTNLADRMAAMSPAERAGAGQRADLLAAIGQGLMGVPYAERPAVLAHLTPALAARGVPPAAVAAFDPTDEALDAAVASARSLEGMLAEGG
ncbi:MAG: hypothetical protein ACR2F8_04060 [Caulobacteraceae bacterium]